MLSSTHQIELTPEAMALIRVAAAARVTLVAEPAIGAWLRMRGLTEATVVEWGLGYWNSKVIDDLVRRYELDPAVLTSLGLTERLSGRIMFPLESVAGEMLGFVGRSTPWTHYSSSVKWLYPKKSPFFQARSHLFGFHRVVGRGRVIVVEGPMDAIVGQQYGYPAVGVTRSTFTLEQAMLLASLQVPVYLVPDADQTGERNLLRSAQRWRHLLPEEVWFAKLPPGSDPASCLVDHGQITFETALSNADRI